RCRPPSRGRHPRRRPPRARASSPFPAPFKLRNKVFCSVKYIRTECSVPLDRSACHPTAQSMPKTAPSPLSGRRRQAARNDQLILQAAREVFLANPGAPISDVARRAAVGISALYARYASKEDLLRKLCTDGLQRFVEET